MYSIDKIYSKIANIVRAKLYQNYINRSKKGNKDNAKLIQRMNNIGKSLKLIPFL